MNKKLFLAFAASLYILGGNAKATIQMVSMSRHVASSSTQQTTSITMRALALTILPTRTLN